MIKVRRSSWFMLTNAPLKQEPGPARALAAPESEAFVAEFERPSGSIVLRALGRGGRDGPRAAQQAPAAPAGGAH